VTELENHRKIWRKIRIYIPNFQKYSQFGFFLYFFMIFVHVPVTLRRRTGGESVALGKIVRKFREKISMNYSPMLREKYSFRENFGKNTDFLPKLSHDFCQCGWHCLCSPCELYNIPD